MNPATLVYANVLFDMSLALALIAAGILLLGGIISLAVYAYKTVAGEGVPDPREVSPEKTGDDDTLRKGDSDDEWDYY